jgi:hypothetical protein
MTVEGFEGSLRSFARHRPFQKFWIEFHTGDSIHVVHAEAVRIRGTLALYFATNGRQRVFDGTSVCQLLEEEPEIELLSPDE